MYNTPRLLTVAMLMVSLLLLTAGSAQAILVKAGSTTLFNDDFESAPEVAGDIGDPVDANPVATVGSWTIQEERNGSTQVDMVQVTNAEVPGPVQGDNYLRLQRTLELGSESATARAYFSGPQYGGTVDISYAVNLDMFDPFKTYAIVQEGNTGRCRYWMETKEDSTVEVWYQTSSEEVFSGLSFVEDEWVRFDMHIDLDSQLYDLTLSGGSGTNGKVSDIAFYTSGNGVDNIRLAIGRYTIAYFDAVSEGDILPGDLNDDGFVGGDDLDIVRSFWGQNVTPGDLLSGDPSGDGFVGGDDLDIVRSDWGQGTPPAPSAVPEPTALAVVLAGALAVLVPRRRW